MPRYIQLMTFTDQGRKTIRDWPTRVASAPIKAKSEEGLYMTMGQYDLVRIVEFESDEACTTATLALDSVGNLRTVTMKAFTQDEAMQIIARMD